MVTRSLQLPSLGEGVAEAVVAGLLVAVGDRVAPGQPLIEVETDKVTVDVPAGVGGTIEAIHVEVGDSIQAGDVYMTLIAAAETAPVGTETAGVDAQDEETSATPAPEAPSLQPQQPAVAEIPPFPRTQGRIIAAGPVSRRMARELGVDIADVQGSGYRGRISVQDVKAHVRRLLAGSPPHGAHATAPAGPPLPDIAAFGPVQRQPLSRIGQVTSVHMQQAWSQIPHAWLQEEADITELEAARQRHKAQAAQAGGALTLTAILVKVLASALAEFPLFNAVLDAEANQVILREYIHVGVAMDTERGLLVPVVRDVGAKSLLQIAQELSELTGQARQNRLRIDDLQGAGFTLSNLGGIGLTSMLPIVNWPQVAILGVAAGREQPRYVDGQLQPRLLLPLTLGFDHRLINGADGARFLTYIAEMLADPFLLVLR